MCSLPTLALPFGAAFSHCPEAPYLACSPADHKSASHKCAASQQKAQQQSRKFLSVCLLCSAVCELVLTCCVWAHAEEDPFSDELDVEKELARLVRSADKSEELQDLDR